jgi:hypothetical protein
MGEDYGMGLTKSKIVRLVLDPAKTAVYFAKRLLTTRSLLVTA